MPYAFRECQVCVNPFRPRAAETRCATCRRLGLTEPSGGYESYVIGSPLPQAETHYLAPPLKQAVFDLETFSLDRGWGVLMVGCILVHSEGQTWYEYDLTQSSKWPKVRSDDSELATSILKILSDCDIAYAHNGLNFDIKWLNTIALRYNLPTLNIKLIDPVQVARRKYRIGNNSLASMSAFLGLPESKMPLSADVWRHALMDNDAASWDLLRARCRSDVSLLNQVASRVTKDVGMIDYQGSWR